MIWPIERVLGAHTLHRITHIQLPRYHIVGLSHAAQEPANDDSHAFVAKIYANNRNGAISEWKQLFSCANNSHCARFPERMVDRSRVYDVFDKCVKQKIACKKSPVRNWMSIYSWCWLLLCQPSRCGSTEVCRIPRTEERTSKPSANLMAKEI